MDDVEILVGGGLSTLFQFAKFAENTAAAAVAAVAAAAAAAAVAAAAAAAVAAVVGPRRVVMMPHCCSCFKVNHIAKSTWFQVEVEGCNRSELIFADLRSQH